MKCMDIVSNLPTELSQYILSLLNPLDLKTCLEVSKKWRQLSNSEHIWKSKCVKENIFQERFLRKCVWQKNLTPSIHTVSKENEEADLNTFARAYFDYHAEWDFNWIHGYSDISTLLQDSNYIYTDGKTLFTSRNEKLFVHVLHPELKQSHVITFPNFIGHRMQIISDTAHIVRLWGNLVLIYQLETGNYNLKSVSAFLANDLVSINEDLKDIEYYCREDVTLIPLFLLKEILWVYVPSCSTIHLYNVSNLKRVAKLRNIQAPIRAKEQCQERVLLKTKNQILCYNYLGELAFRLSSPRIISSIHVWDSSSAFSLLSECLPKKEGSIALTSGCLVHVATYPQLMQITLCYPGRQRYTRSYNSGSDAPWNIALRVIRDKFIVCSPGLHLSAYSLFELPSLKFMYSKRDALCVEYIDDNGIICSDLINNRIIHFLNFKPVFNYT